MKLLYLVCTGVGLGGTEMETLISALDRINSKKFYNAAVGSCINGASEMLGFGSNK